MGRLIIDADILIDASRGHAKALAFLEEHEADIALSVVTITELYAGVRGREEESGIHDLCKLFERIEVNEAIAISAGKLRNHYGKSHGTGVVDCIVAATAKLDGLALATLNKKHYPMLKDVLVPYKKH